MGMAEVGSWLYVFSRHKKGAMNTGACIIKAHGCQYLGAMDSGPQKTFQIDGGKMHFYCPNGSTLSGNIWTFVKGEYQTNAYEAFEKEVAIPDLLASKSIGRHQSKAFNKLGQAEIDGVIEKNSAEAERLCYSNYKMIQAMVEMIQAMVEDGRCPCDFVTVRNRWFKGIGDMANRITLSDIYKKLIKHGYGYGNYYVYMCRSKFGGKSPLWDIHTGKHI